MDRTPGVRPPGSHEVRWRRVPTVRSLALSDVSDVSGDDYLRDVAVCARDVVERAAKKGG
jgi:hypothetical protein